VLKPEFPSKVDFNNLSEAQAVPTKLNEYLGSILSDYKKASK
jgi:hypothetical protein